MVWLGADVVRLMKSHDSKRTFCCHRNHHNPIIKGNTEWFIRAKIQCSFKNGREVSSPSELFM